jgi:cytochrome P450 family 6
MGAFSLAALLLVVVLFGYYKWKYQYWRKKKLPFLQPQIPFGNILNPITSKECFGVTMARVYSEMKRNGWKHGGGYVFLSPMYVLVDLNYIKDILTKDFHCFIDRGFFHNEKDDPISNNIFLMSGTNKWKKMRAKFTSIFSSGRMKDTSMFQTLVKCSPHLLSSLEADRVKDQPTNIKDTMSSFTMEVIGSYVFGLDLDICNDENSPFRFFAEKVFPTTFYSIVKRIFYTIFPNLAKSLGVCTIPKDVSEFFTGVVKDTAKYRVLNNHSRPDFIQLLIDLKNSGEALTIEEIAAQCFVFFLAGIETSATAETFTLYELAKNQDIQE